MNNPNLSPAVKWLLAYGVLFVVLSLAAETDSLGEIAAAMAVLIAGGATFAMLPTSMKNLGLL